MFFSIRTAVTLLATGLLVASGVHADDCTGAPVDSTKTYGQDDPHAIGYCHTKWAAGLVVDGLEVWSTRWQITGLQFRFSDGSKYPVIGSDHFGTNDDGNDGQGGDSKHNFVSWNSTSDKIKTFRLANNSKGDALGLVHVETEAGQMLHVDSDDVGDGETMNVASGILLGGSGTSSNFVNSLTPLFMGTRTGHAEIIDIQFDENLDEINKKQLGLQDMDVSEMYIQNTNPANGSNQTWEFSGSVTKHASTSIDTSSTAGFSFSEAIEVGAEVDVPLVAKASVKSTTTVGFTMSKTHSTSSTDGWDVALNWKQGSTLNQPLAPGMAKHCYARTTMGKYNSWFTSTIKMVVNGKDFTFKQRGQFASTSYSDVYTSCDDIKVSDVP